MNPAIYLPFFSLLMFVGIFSALYALLKRRVNLKERVLGYEREPVGDQRGQRIASSMESVFAPLGKMLKRSPEDLSKESLRLVQAGFRKKNAVFMFYGVRVAVAGLFWALLSLSGMPANNPLLFLILPVLLAAALPDMWLRQRIKGRQLRIQLALPDLTDLTVICVEAGMGLDQALMRIRRELGSSHRDLSDELHLYNLEVNAGKSRAQSLRNLATRTGVNDLKALAAVLIQADRFGTSIARTLRVYSDSLRTKRRQRAEEAAAKMNVKMIGPLLLFIFPAIFVIVAGPAVIAIMRDLLPSLGGG